MRLTDTIGGWQLVNVARIGFITDAGLLNRLPDHEQPSLSDPTRETVVIDVGLLGILCP